MSADGWLAVLILVLVVLFAGDPDLHDAIVRAVMPK
jgi:hypothetical protein